MHSQFSTPADFWRRVDKNGPNGCWVWTKACNPKNGYGTLTYHYKTWTAHRLSYVFSYGEIPNDLWVLHRCDNPPCCNPAHLFLGTPADNIRDMIDKGRMNRKRVNFKPNPKWLRGEMSLKAKVTEADVRNMREMHKSGVTLTELARKYGLHFSTVQAIIRRETWKHVA